MDFTFSEEDLMMAQSARDLLAEVCSGEALRALAEKKPGAADDRWRRLAELGLCGVLAPESAGGLGLGDASLVLIAEAAGYAALPEPLIEQAAVVTPLLRAISAEWTARAASGAERFAIAPEGQLALDAGGADVIIVERDGGVHAVERADAKLTPQQNIDPTRALSRVVFEPSAKTLLKGDAAPLWRRARRRGAIYTAAQLCGLSDRMQAIAVAYTSERKQFGRALGANQAVKHLLANVAVKTGFAKPAVYAAAAFADDDSQRSAVRASHAKIAAGDAADLAARSALQVHGAMGYSWEVDLHFYMKRAWALIGAWGDRNVHARRIERALFDGAIALGPDQTFSG